MRFPVGTGHEYPAWEKKPGGITVRYMGVFLTADPEPWVNSMGEVNRNRLTNRAQGHGS